MAADLEFWNPQEDYLFPVSRSGRVKPCLHCHRRHQYMLMGLLAALSLIAGIVAAFLVHPAPAYSGSTSAQLTVSRESVGSRMLDAAETKTGDWYSYGAAGPSFFDCSGIVAWSAAHLGERSWPRDTFSLIAAVASGRLSYTSHPQRGDLAFYGTGHVEFVTIWYHVTFGAQQTGTRVGWHKYDPRYWGPTFFLHINW